MVIDNFFEPSLDPMETSAAASSTVGGSRRSPPAARRSVQEGDLTRIDRKPLNVNMSERTAVLAPSTPRVTSPG